MKWLNFATQVVSEVVNRLPLERLLSRPLDNRKRLEELAEILGNAGPQKQRPETITEHEQISDSLEEIAKEARGTTDIATGCVPCSIGHFGTCAGILNEAMRFARKDGLQSNEVLDRLNKALDELNTMERIDLDSEKIYALPDEEKEIAIKALNASRATRHALESLTTVNDLEKATADVQTIRRDIGREWYRYRLSKVPKEKLTEADIEAIGDQDNQG